MISTLFKSHSFFTRREDALDELKRRIKTTTGEEGPSFALTPGFQTHLPLITYDGKSPVVKQDTILVEAETKHADQVLENLFKSIMDRNEGKWPITGRLQFIPVRSFGRIDKNLIRHYAMRQNSYMS